MGNFNKKIFEIIKKIWPITAIILLSVIFFIGTASYNRFSQKNDFVKWLSPDETANYIFSKLYAQTGELSIYEKYNFIAEDIIRPRSFRSDFGEMKPVSFLGIILIYGSIAASTSYKVIPFLTPFFAAISIIFYYLLIKKIFGKKAALLSSLMLASFPVYIYYSARSMFHNVLFISLLIIGLYFSVAMVSKEINSDKLLRHKALTWIFAGLGGLFIGLAIITRTSEVLWLAPAVFLLWLFNIKKVGITKLFIFISFLSLAILPVLYWNKILYSSPINSGYPEMNQSISNITSSGGELLKSTISLRLEGAKELLLNVRDNVFHFGFKPDQSIKMVYHYFIKMFPLIFWPAAIGLILFFQRFFRWKKRHLVYMIDYVLISAVLIFYYGSWKFFDNPDPNSFTIGNSYTRYWLPIYLGAFPFASLFIIKLTKAFAPVELPYSPEVNEINKLNVKDYLRILKRYAKRSVPIALQIVIICIIIVSSVRYVLYGSEEGLVYSAQKQAQMIGEQDAVLNSTPSQAVIITKYHDKLFFPERKVIVGLFDDDNMNLKYAKLAEILPIYYYNFTFPEKDFNYLNERKLKTAGFSIEPVESISDFTLYKLNLMNKVEN